jgi:hypothetical protein
VIEESAVIVGLPFTVVPVIPEVVAKRFDVPKIAGIENDACATAVVC